MNKQNKPRLLILAPFSNHYIELLSKHWDIVYEDWTVNGVFQDPLLLGIRLHNENFKAIVVEADFLFEETFQEAPNIGFIGVCRQSTNHIDIEAATQNGIVVVNTPARNADAVAEMTIALMLTILREVHTADKIIREGKWVSPTFAYQNLKGLQLNTSKVGVVGLGAIGRKVAYICNAMGATVMGYDPLLTKSQSEEFGLLLTDLKTLVVESNIISLHAPPSAGTLITSDLIESMQVGTIIINTASSDLIDEKAMVIALEKNRIKVGLDVFTSHPIEPYSPLMQTPNTLLTPHIGGATHQVIINHSRMMFNDIERFRLGQRPKNLVNPNVWAKRFE